MEKVRDLIVLNCFIEVEKWASLRDDSSLEQVNLEQRGKIQHNGWIKASYYNSTRYDFIIRVLEVRYVNLFTVPFKKTRFFASF